MNVGVHFRCLLLNSPDEIGNNKQPKRFQSFMFAGWVQTATVLKTCFITPVGTYLNHKLGYYE